MDLHQETFQLFAQWITFLWQALPPKLQPTLLELLFGAMISRKGHITSAIMCIRRKLHWNSYFKAIERGRFSWLALARQWLRLLIQLFQTQGAYPHPGRLHHRPGFKKSSFRGTAPRSCSTRQPATFPLGATAAQFGHYLQKRLPRCFVSSAAATDAHHGQYQQIKGRHLPYEPAAQTHPGEYGGESAYRCLVHACSPGSGTDPARSRCYRSGPQRYGPVSAARYPAEKDPGQTSKVWAKTVTGIIFCSSTRNTR